MIGTRVAGERVSLSNARIVITGADGQLGRYLRDRIVRVGAMPIGFSRNPSANGDQCVDVTDRDAVHRAVDAARPDAIIHAAAYTDVDGCERDRERADLVNGQGSAIVAAAAVRSGAHMVMVSTDFVFPGDGDAPYSEDARPGPLSVYGASKRAGEVAVHAADPSFAVVRTAWLYGGAGKHFPRTVLTLLQNRDSIDVVDDEVGNPTFAGDLADALVQLVGIGAGGTFHLTNADSASRFDLAREVARVAGLDPERVRPISSAAFLASYPLPARRPADSRLFNTRAASLGITLRPWREAIGAYIPQLAADLGIHPPRDRQQGGHQR